jgi:hypothetical protein
MTAVAAHSPFVEHDASPSKALHLSTTTFQIRATSANLLTGNYGQAGARPGPREDDSARTACATAARVLSSLHAVAKDSRSASCSSSISSSSSSALRSASSHHSRVLVLLQFPLGVVIRGGPDGEREGGDCFYLFWRWKGLLLLHRRRRLNSVALRRWALPHAREASGLLGVSHLDADAVV